MADGAEPRQVDPFPSYACDLQLGSIYRFQVKMSDHWRSAEPDGDLRPNFKAAPANAWSDGRVYVVGTGSPALPHRFQCRTADFGDSASPPRMHGGDGLMALVNQQNRQTIRSLHANQAAGTIGK